MVIPKPPHAIIRFFRTLQAVSETPLLCYIGGVEPLPLDARAKQFKPMVTSVLFATV